MQRVVITGMGVVSPIGKDINEFMHGIATARQGISTIQNFNTEHFPSPFGAEVKINEVDSKLGTAIDRKTVFLEKALAELLSSFPNALHHYPPSNRLLNLGSGLDYFDLPGYVDSEDRKAGNWHDYSKNSYKAIERIALKYDIQGGINVNVSACVASNHAIGLSFRIQKQCPHKIIITGGMDSMLNPLHYMGFYKLGALSNWTGDPASACRPFDKNRSGLVLGEGAAVLLLQNEAEAEPEKILAEIVGYSASMDAYMVTDPQPDGTLLAKAAVNAIHEANITPDEIDCVHLHGTGTPKNDPAEAHAMKLIFGDRYKEIPVFALKGQVGHLIGACGAMEMLGVIYSLQTQQVPPTVNFVDADPDIPLRVVVGKPLEMNIRYILKLNAAFGGQNSALVVKRVE
jgi:3-oxoacyl-[acyl-carrier-protein] synthase II